MTAFTFTGTFRDGELLVARGPSGREIASSLVVPSTFMYTVFVAANAAAARALLGVVAFSGAFVDLTGLPTTLAGYGITDGVVSTRQVNGHALSADVTVSKSDVGLSAVENTALSTWAGTANLVTLGTITTGTWHGTAIAAAYLGAHASAHQPGGSDAMAVDAAAATGSLRTLGTGAAQALPGNAIASGRVSLKNTGAGAPTYEQTISNTAVAAANIIVVSAERDANSAAGVAYIVNIKESSRVVGTSFVIQLTRRATANVATNEGCTLNYLIF